MSAPESTPALDALEGRQLVKLTYYKARGKYYTEGEFFIAKSMEIFQIWDHVNEMRDRGDLPGLIAGAGKEFIISIDAPGHRHERPRLLMP